MHTVAVAGAGSPLGRRVAEALRADGASVVPLMERTDDLGGADVVVQLERTAIVPWTRQLLEAAGRQRVGGVVHLSNATVYGAWADNPVPLTEQAPLRPNPGVTEAIQWAEAERLVADWADAHSRSSVAVLRPVPVLPWADGRLTRALCGQAPVRTDDPLPPRQFVHVDDVASAVALAASEGLDGPFNVAPDRWIPGDLVPDLVAGGRPLPLPVSLAGTVAGWLWTLRLSDLPPGALALLRHPWVVANDRLRGAGWQPRYSNEEALVAGRPGSPWREMSPRRRQEVALGAAGLGVAAAVAGATTALARRRRGRA